MRLVWVVVVVMLGLGCQPHTSYKELSRVPLPSQSRKQGSPRPDGGIHVAGTFANDGSIAFTLSRSCQHTHYTVERFRVKERAKRGPHFVGTLVGAGLGGIYTVLGIGLTTVGLFDEENRGVFMGIGIPVGVIGGLLFTNLFFKNWLKRKTWVRTRERSGKWKLSQKQTACPKRSRRAWDEEAHDLGDAPARRGIATAITVTTPWGSQLRSDVSNDTARVNPDWSQAGYASDPKTRAMLGKSWTITAGSIAASWTPDDRDVQHMLARIARVTGDDTPVVRGGPPPQLEVIGMPSNLVAGVSTDLRLTLTNKGQGIAYRVVVQTSSGEQSLHRKRFVFGSIKPGRTVTKAVPVQVPVTHKGGSAVMVLRFSEANNNAPAQITRRIQIIAGKTAALSLRCRIAKGATKSGKHWTADAGARLLVRCRIRNVGRAVASNASVRGTLAHTTRSSIGRNLRPNAETQADLLLPVPANATTGQRLDLLLKATEQSVGQATTTQRLSIEVGAQRICTPPITRAEYNRKMKKLRADLRNKLLDKEAFQRFEAQLVGCLQ